MLDKLNLKELYQTKPKDNLREHSNHMSRSWHIYNIIKVINTKLVTFMTNEMSYLFLISSLIIIISW